MVCVLVIQVEDQRFDSHKEKKFFKKCLCSTGCMFRPLSGNNCGKDDQFDEEISVSDRNNRSK